LKALVSRKKMQQSDLLGKFNLIIKFHAMDVAQRKIVEEDSIVLTEMVTHLRIPAAVSQLQPSLFLCPTLDNHITYALLSKKASSIT